MRLVGLLTIILASATLARADGLPELAASAAARHRLDVALVRAVVSVESAWNPRARSGKGAMGLMQLMPGTARDLGVSDPFDAEQSLEGGCSYLRQLLEEFGTLPLALAAYNAGPEAVRRAGRVPDYEETRQYVSRILDAIGWREARLPIGHSMVIGLGDGSDQEPLHEGPSMLLSMGARS